MITRGTFPTIGSAECRRHIQRARRTPNSIRAQVAAGIIFLASASVGHSTPESFGTELKLLQAIRTVEGVKHPATPGRHGELGFFRFRQKTWEQHTAEPFARCGRSPKLELEIAVKHLHWLVQGIVAAGEVPTPYRIALAWNAGLEATIFDRVPATTRDYARRVVNVFAESGEEKP